MINRCNKFLIFLLFLFIIAVPVSFAGDLNENITMETASDTNVSSVNDNEILNANEVYFDASASSYGDGSSARPYNYVSSSNLGSINHFAAGTYRISGSLSNSFSFSSSAMSFIGESRDTTILEYTGSGTFMTTSSDVSFSGITLKNVHFVTTGGLFTAVNTVFDGGRAPVEMEANNYYDNSYGGAIKQSASSSEFDWGGIFGGSTEKGMKLTDCIFKNNYAAYGGAIYIDGGTAEITNTRFESNHAPNAGGAVFAANGAKLTVTGCEFVKDYSSYDAGGALYIFNSSQATVKSSTFTDCSASAGSAIASLNATVTVTDSDFRKNRASWHGGALFAMYGTLTLMNSDFNENSALSGGAVFADNLTLFTVSGGTFSSNTANDTAGAIFAFANKQNRITNPTYSSNRAKKENNLFEAQTIDLILGSDEYEMIQYQSSYTGSLPSKYDLRTEGGVTPVKDQAQSGNCWAFATMATLESAILKATGKQFDLSEGNLKNLAARFSDIGWDYETNGGGMYPFVIGYLTSWAGPVTELQDPTDDWDVFAPILNSAVHIQNIKYLKRTSFTDNRAIKEAIMKYGAVCSEIYWQNSYNGGGSDCYYSGTPQRNHAISVIGWDDTKSISGAPGKGAWIIKNSYGTSHGDGGYYYVSYYDTSLFKVNDESYNSFAVIFNDTERYSKNYQYDPAFTDYFMTGDKELWYKNTFTSTGNDILKAFSTYFRYATEWEAQIFLNDRLQLTQSGSSDFGYYTIPLTQAVPLKLGDNFTVSVKIRTRLDASIPISEYGPAYTMTKQYFGPGVSFFSRDGATWTDFYAYKSTYGSGESGHNYFNQVACIKAFTSEGLKEVLNTTVEIISANATDIRVKITDINGNNVNTGKVEFTVAGKTYSRDVDADKIDDLYLPAGNTQITATYIENDYYHSSTVTKTVAVSRDVPNISVEADNIEYGQALDVTVTVTDSIGREITLPLTAEINGKKYTSKTFKVYNLSSGIHQIKVQTAENDKFEAGSASKIISVAEKELKDANASLTIYDANCPANSTIVNVGDISAVIMFKLDKSSGEFTDETLTVYVDNGSCKNHFSVNVGSGKIGEFKVSEGNTFVFSAVYTAHANGKDILASSGSLTYVSKNAEVPVSVNLTIWDANFPDKTSFSDVGDIAASLMYKLDKSSADFKNEVLTLFINNVSRKVTLNENGKIADYTVSAGNTYVFYAVYTASVNGKTLTASSGNLTYVSSAYEVSVTADVSGDAVTVNVRSNADGNYEIILDGSKYDIDVKDGVGSKVFGNLKSGNHNVTVSNSHITNSTSFAVAAVEKSKVATRIMITSVDKNKIIHGSLKDINSRPVTDTKVSVNVDNRTDIVDVDSKGEFTFAATSDKKIEISFAGDDNYLGSDTEFIMEGGADENIKLESHFNVSESQAIDTYAVDFNAGEKGKVFQFRLTDSKGNAIADAPVKFAYKTVILNRTTDKNGIVSLGVSTQFADSYLCALSYAGDENHNAAFVAFSFKLSKKPILITAKAKTFKKSVKIKKFTVTLKTKKCASRDAKVYLKAGKKVTLKINGKTYTAKINKKGQATFKLTKLTKKGKYAALVKFTGDSTYGAASQKVKITVK